MSFVESGRSLVDRIHNDHGGADDRDIFVRLAQRTGEQRGADAVALVAMVDRRTVTVATGREVLERLLSEGGDPAAVVESEGLAAVGGADALAPVVAAAIEANAEAAQRIREGKMGAIGPIIGYVMRETSGRADGGEVTRLVRAQLGL